MELAKRGPFAIYGEWVVAAHGIVYNRLPDWLIAYDVYDYESKIFLPPPKSRELLQELEFAVPRELFVGDCNLSYNDLAWLTLSDAQWAEDDKVEGIYVKTFDDKKVLHRFKMIRNDFVRGRYWDTKVITRNELMK